MDNFFISWAAPKEVAVEWNIYLGLLLLLSIPLVVDFAVFKGMRRKLTMLILAGAVGGFILLSTTEVGMAWPDLIAHEPGQQLQAEVFEGEKIFFKYGCPNCHQLEGFGARAGPDLSGVSTKMTREQLTTYIMGYQSGDLHAVMPKYQQSMTAHELRLLLEFLTRL